MKQCVLCYCILFVGKAFHAFLLKRPFNNYPSLSQPQISTGAFAHVGYFVCFSPRAFPSNVFSFSLCHIFMVG